MTGCSEEALATLLSEEHRRLIRIRSARDCRATTETRIVLVAFELGISDRQLAQFYFVNRKGAKKRHFDTDAFAKKYGVDVHWLWDGDLRGHPRGLTRKPIRKGGPPGGNNSPAMVRHDCKIEAPACASRAGGFFHARRPNPGRCQA
jgi:hypothetical protein